MEEHRTAREVIVDAGHAGQRIDNYLMARLRDLPRARIYRMLRKGEVRINGARVRPDRRVARGDRVRLPPVRRAPRPEAAPVPPAVLAELEQAILHEDEDLLVLDKPAGLAVHAGSGLRWGVIEALRQLRPNAPALELVHRLDRATSGCLLVARRRPALLTLHQLLREGAVEKTYLCLVVGRWRGGPRRVEMALSRGGGQGRAHAAADGKPAVTDFEPLRRFADATLLRARLHTGRTHQIRVHAAELGHPLLGDDKYGDFAANRQWRRRGLRRLFLHSATVAFRWPRSGRPMRFEAPLPADLQDLLDRLQENRA